MNKRTPEQIAWAKRARELNERFHGTDKSKVKITYLGGHERCAVCGKNDWTVGAYPLPKPITYLNTTVTESYLCSSCKGNRDEKKNREEDVIDCSRCDCKSAAVTHITTHMTGGKTYVYTCPECQMKMARIVEDDVFNIGKTHRKEEK